MNISKVFGGALTLASIYGFSKRYQDETKSEDAFSKHTNSQQKKHFISGMHEPYIPNSDQQALIEKHFSEFQHLIPKSLEGINAEYQLKSPVSIRKLADCPVIEENRNFENEGTVVVGGPPALISTAFETNIIYINDSQRKPIAYGSAFHLEWDAQSEAPTSTQPLHFMIDQIKRVFSPELLANISKTGDFSWKSLDWISWIKNPSKWGAGIRIALAFQRFTTSDASSTNKEVAARTKKNQQFYEKLNEELQGRLMGKDRGSVYIARNESEKEGLLQMLEGLQQEDRKMEVLLEQDIIKRFGYLPKGVFFGEKTHDRVLSPLFLSLLSKRIVERGGQVIDAKVKTIYTDDPDKGGFVAYELLGGNTHYVPFKKLVMSLGTQSILGIDDKPLFDIVAARGVSMVALAYLPNKTTLPQAFVCGGSNHVIKLAGPIPFDEQNLYLLRMTCGACITPNSDSPDYDGRHAVGLKTAVEDVLKGRVEILTVYGCNRQVSQYGQTHFLQVPKTLKAASLVLTPRGDKEDIGPSLPYRDSGVYIQYGAGGGGLTQAPSQTPTKE